MSETRIMAILPVPGYNYINADAVQIMVPKRDVAWLPQKFEIVWNDPYTHRCPGLVEMGLKVAYRDDGV